MPKYFHGLTKKRSFFEGWYFKHIHNGNLLGLIPGIHIDHAGRRFAFIEVITNYSCYYVHYPFSAFEASKDQLYIQVGESQFSTKGIRIYIDTPELSLKGAINYAPLQSIPYDTMGPFCFLPFLNCHSEIISLSHSISGFIKLNGQLLNFDDGKGYIETEWGRSFPKYQIWTQCNSFPTEPLCSIVVSIANLCFINKSFVGCVGAITYHDCHYRFATHLGTKIINASEKGFTLVQGDYLLKVTLLASYPTSIQPDICSCLRGDIPRILHQSSKCTIEYHLKLRDQTLFCLISDEASFEWIP